ncbi:hypothetical protein N9157_01985 [Saprospiraceae bacterium]|nr:hypothetical protein [Saprospiraceae bacterium]
MRLRNQERYRRRKRNRSISEHVQNAYYNHDELIDFLNRNIDEFRCSEEELKKHFDAAIEERERVIQISKEINKPKYLKRYLFGLLNEYGDIFFSLIHPIDIPHDEESGFFERYQKNYSAYREYLLELTKRVQQEYQSKKLLLFVKQVELTKYKGFKVLTNNGTALKHVYDFLVKKGFIESCGLPKFRRCFDGRGFDTQIVWTKSQNQLKQFIIELTDENNGYIFSYSKKWVVAVNIFVIRDENRKIKSIKKDTLKGRTLEYPNSDIIEILKRLTPPVKI